MELLGMDYRVNVDRARLPSEALAAASGCQPYVNQEAVDEMPGRGDGRVCVEVLFFKLDCAVDEEELDKEYEARGLVPADPYALAAVNETDPLFSRSYPNGTHWKDKRGRWCVCKFSSRAGVREVRAGFRLPYVRWTPSWWFAGVRIL